MRNDFTIQQHQYQPFFIYEVLVMSKTTTNEMIIKHQMVSNWLNVCSIYRLSIGKSLIRRNLIVFVCVTLCFDLQRLFFATRIDHFHLPTFIAFVS